GGESVSLSERASGEGSSELRGDAARQLQPVGGAGRAPQSTRPTRGLARTHHPRLCADDRRRAREWPAGGATDGTAAGQTTPPAIATPTPRATPTTPTTPANPWGTAPSNGNWQQWWTQNVGTNAPSLAYLQGLESQLQPVGVKLNRNASNAINGKITLPSGQV